MLEREPDLAACRVALERAAQGRGGFLVIQGPAGIGKTALLRAFLDAASKQRLRVLTARATELERDLPFGVVRQLYEAVVIAAERDADDRLLAGAAALTRRLLGTAHQEAGAGDPYTMLHGLYWLTSALAEEEPLVLAIDDAHWLDQPSLRFLSFMQPRVSELPVLIALTTRPLHAEPDDEPLDRIVVDPETYLVRPQPLSRDAVAALVLDRLGQADEKVTEECATVTGGNPFYLVELLRDLERAGRSSSGSPRAVGPRTIAQALRFRGRASTDGAAIARALAVLGDGSRIHDVAALAAIDIPRATLAADALIADGLLTGGPELAFAHPIVRTAVYDDIGPQERAAMHARAARMMPSTSGTLDRIAMHLLSTEPDGDPWVVQVLRSAASGARTSGAPEVAARYLLRALDERPDGPELGLLLADLGHAEASLGAPTAVERFVQAQAALTDPALRADTAIAAGMAFAAMGSKDKAIEMLDAAAAELPFVERDTALTLEARLAIVSIFEFETAWRYLNKVDRPEVASFSGDSLGEQLMMCVLGCVHTWLGRDADEAARLTERGLTDDLIDHRGPAALEIEASGITLVYADRHEAASRLIQRLAVISRDTGNRFGYALVSLMRAALGTRRGTLSDAESSARLVLAIVLESRQPVFASVGGAELVVALTEQGAFKQAHTELDLMGLDTAPAPADAMYTAILSARGRLHLAEGNMRASVADLQECGRRCVLLGNRSPVFMPWRGDAARALHSLGQHDAATEMAERHLDDARRWGTPGAIGSAQHVMGLIAEPSGAIDWLRAAVSSLESSPARLDLAKALVDHGSALRRAGYRAEARGPLTRGLDLADQCGARPLSDHARFELAAIGVRPRRARLTGVEALTASEHRVAQMAAEGMSNVEIAQTLFVTRKTVEKHLGNAYGKLGVTSRRSLAPFFGGGQEPLFRSPPPQQVEGHRL